MARTEYITIAELNEILGAEYCDNDATLLKINVASELMEYHLFNSNYTASNAPDNLKLATAYQVEYNDSNNDNEYASGTKSVGIGRTSETLNLGSNGVQEHLKIAPKSRRYLCGLTSRTL